MHIVAGLQSQYRVTGMFGQQVNKCLELFAVDSALIGIQDLRLQTRLFKQRINRDTFGIGVANILPQSGDGSCAQRIHGDDFRCWNCLKSINKNARL